MQLTYNMEKDLKISCNTAPMSIVFYRCHDIIASVNLDKSARNDYISYVYAE